jgi:hypothetical protein
MLHAVSWALLFLATATAIAVARRSRDYKAIALFLGAVFIESAIREVIAHFIYTEPGDPPLVGLARLLFSVDVTLYLIDPFGLAAAAVFVFTGRRPWLAMPAWAACAVALAASYPWSRGEHLRQVYLAIELTALFTGVISFALWVRRRESAPLPQCAMVMIVAIEFAIVMIGPWRYGFFSRWDLAQAAQLVLFSVLILLQGGTLWLKSTS